MPARIGQSFSIADVGMALIVTVGTIAMMMGGLKPRRRKAAVELEPKPAPAPAAPSQSDQLRDHYRKRYNTGG